MYVRLAEPHANGFWWPQPCTFSLVLLHWFVRAGSVTYNPASPDLRPGTWDGRMHARIALNTQQRDGLSVLACCVGPAESAAGLRLLFLSNHWAYYLVHSGSCGMWPVVLRCCSVPGLDLVLLGDNDFYSHRHTVCV